MSEPLLAPAEDVEVAPAPPLQENTPGPRHVAIIMDGNRRWAARHNRPAAAGHRAGANNVKRVAEACVDAGVEYLTLFAFSTENWLRPQREVGLLMKLMRGFLQDDLDELRDNDVKLNIIGDRSRFAADLQRLMNRAEQMTRLNQRLFLTVAVNYGGRWDIAQAAQRLAADASAGRLDPCGIDDSTFASYLNLADLPAPDLCIRTGGERRISNFLLWDIAYAELYFTDDCWPDFDAASLGHAVADFRSRQRRYGRQ